MAERPVFVPLESGTSLVQEVQVQFTWHSGFAPSQKKKNVVALHERAALIGLDPLLEISSKSDHELGQKLSAFDLKIYVDNMEITLECAFQGSKVFEYGGPFSDLYHVSSREAKRDPRLKDSGRLIGFHFEHEDYPLSPSTIFYDWLYVNALFLHREWLERLQQCAGFTDIEFNPHRSVNCQARSCATFVALEKRGLLDCAIESFGAFHEIVQRASV